MNSCLISNRHLPEPCWLTPLSVSGVSSLLPWCEKHADHKSLQVVWKCGQCEYLYKNFIKCRITAKQVLSYGTKFLWIRGVNQCKILLITSLPIVHIGGKYIDDMSNSIQKAFLNELYNDLYLDRLRSYCHLILRLHYLRCCMFRQLRSPLTSLAAG